MTAKFAPLISIVMPIHNAEVFLAEALDSCLGQTYRPIEIICVNNNSTDGTADILEMYQKKYPAILKLVWESSPGAPSARNRGIKEAVGEYVCFLDSDDALLPEALETLYKNIEGGIDAVCGGENYYYSNLNTAPAFERKRIKNDDFHLGDILYDSPNTGAVLLRKSILKGAEWDIELKSEQEIVFWSELCLKNNAKYKFIRDRVCKIRIHNSPGRISNQSKGKKAYNKYVAILKIESLLETSAFRLASGEIAFNDFKLTHAFNAINAKNFKVSQLTSGLVNKSLLPKSRYFKRMSKEGVTYHFNHYFGFLFHFICYKILGKSYSRIHR